MTTTISTARLATWTRKLTGPWTSPPPAASRSELAIRSYGLTDTGCKRERNEDAFALDEEDGIFVVADGIGGGSHGSVASRLAVQGVREFIATSSGVHHTTRLEEAIRGAHGQILEEIRNDPLLHQMGTTVVSLLVEADFAVVAHVGDSRAYLLRDGELERLTRDHTVASDFMAAGRWSQQVASDHPMANILTRALSCREKLEVDSALVPTRAGDVFLLCSDGLTGMLRDAEIRHVMTREGDAEVMCHRLVEEALKRGAHDNVTAIVVEIL